jgi:hypothetical protein
MIHVVAGNTRRRPAFAYGKNGTVIRNLKEIRA